MKYSVFNTVTGKYEEVDVTPEVYAVLTETCDDFKTDDALRKDEDRHSRNFSRLKCGSEEDGWESFNEVVRYSSDKEKVSHITAYSVEGITAENFEAALIGFKEYLKDFDEYMKSDAKRFFSENETFGIQVMVGEAYVNAMAFDEFEKRYLKALKSLSDMDLRIAFALIHLGMTEREFAAIENVSSAAITYRKKHFFGRLRKFFN